MTLSEDHPEQAADAIAFLLNAMMAIGLILFIGILATMAITFGLGFILITLAPFRGPA